MPGISAADIAYCGGMDPDTRRAWMKAGRLGGPPYSEHDAVETAVAAALSAATNTQRAPRALRSFRTELREASLARAADLWAVVPRQGNQFRLVRGAEAAARTTADLGRPVWIVPLERAVQEARERYAELKAEPRSEGSVSKLPSEKPLSN